MSVIESQRLEHRGLADGPDLCIASSTTLCANMIHGTQPPLGSTDALRWYTRRPSRSPTNS